MRPRKQTKVLGKELRGVSRRRKDASLICSLSCLLEGTGIHVICGCVLPEASGNNSAVGLFFFSF